MTKLKTTIRVATTEQYCYVESEIEGTPQEIRDAYDVLQGTMGKSQFMGEAPFNAYLAKVMNGDINWEGMTPDEYAQLTTSQKELIQAIKRFEKRLPAIEE